MNSGPQQAGYFRKIATILLRVVAIGFAIRGLCLALYQLGWWSSAWQGWFTPAFDLVSAVVLWTYSVRIARVVARGLDEPE